jgi:hypothetical protein
LSLKDASAILVERETEVVRKFGHEKGFVPPPALGQRLAETARELRSELSFAELERRVVAPAAASWLERVSAAMTDVDGAAWAAWQKQYVGDLNALLAALRQHTRDREAELMRTLAKPLAAAFPGSAAPLSMQAIRVLTDVTGVASTLIGMRRPDYVESSLDALKLSLTGSAEAVLSAISNALPHTD